MANKNNLNVGMRCIKYMLVVINLMFLVSSTIILNNFHELRNFLAQAAQLNDKNDLKICNKSLG